MHLAHAREGTGHALIAARQWIPREQVDEPAQRESVKLPPVLAFRTKGRLAIDLIGEVLADGVKLDFACGGEVYGSLHLAAEVPGDPRSLRAAGAMRDDQTTG